ncbi:MAG TPA: hypothetical protein VE734_03740, partial [Terriglobales bacterium]|nr:hypothetical protein [Terriglobales bacterium]
SDRFTSDMNDLAIGRYRIGLLDVDTGKIRPLPTMSDGNSMNPQWSLDGNNLYFLSDANGIANIYRIRLDDHAVTPITNVQTGVSGVTGTSPAFTVAAKSGALVYSAFVKGDFHIERINSPASLPVAKNTMALADLRPALLPPHPRQQSAVESYLQDANTGLVTATNFRSQSYSPHLSLDYVAPPTLAAGYSTFGTSVGGGTQLHFSDLLNSHELNVIGQAITTNGTQNFARNLTGLGNYENNRHRFTWGLTAGQIPYISGGVAVSQTTAPDGTPIFIQQVITFWQEDRPVTAYFAYPFNRAQRIELSGGYENIGFAAQAETDTFDAFGNLLARQTQNIPTPNGLSEGTAAAALVYDTSLFAGVSPVAGQRYRFQAGVDGGTLTFSSVLLDYRRYLHIAKPLSLAGRVLHYGRYGGGAEDPRLQPLFLGYPEFIRGYNINSISANECGANFNQTGTCSIVDQLIGSRIAVANAELRTELLGPLGAIPHTTRVPPLEIGPFYDAGVAWGKSSNPSFVGGPRKTVSSLGGFLRVNLLGFAVGQISYARPHNRPLRDHVWEFTLLPGW